MYDVIILGSGPAGLSAAVYARRSLLNTLVVEKDSMGAGQIVVTDRVDNYLGLYGVSGFELGSKFRGHAEALGAELRTAEAVKISREGELWRVDFKGGSHEAAKAIIYALGASHKRLGVIGDDKRRISYCAVCDGFFYKGKVCAVIGGGDTALGDALFLSKLAKTVYLVHRRNEFRANRSLQKQVGEAENIIPILGAELTEVTGGETADGVRYAQSGEEHQLPLDGIFAAVGSVPNSALLDGICALENGYVRAGEDCVTSAAGIFAAGDVRTTPLRQVITAAADGANAAASAEKYILSRGL